MLQLQFALLLSIVFCTALAAWGVRPFMVEFHSPVRQVLAGLLFVTILTLTVFGPVTSYGNLGAVSLDELTVPEMLFGHLIITVFLIAWWLLRGDIGLARFLSVSSHRLGSQIAQGAATGFQGWLMTILVMMAIVTSVGQSGAAPDAATVPEVMPWMAKLPWTHKAMIVAAAMTIEEAFFRAFLQARLGLVMSSILFALGHFSYGMPFMIVGVFTISVVIGRTFERTGELVPCMIAHGVFDAIQLFVILPYAVRMMEAGSSLAP